MEELGVALDADPVRPLRALMDGDRDPAVAGQVWASGARDGC